MTAPRTIDVPELSTIEPNETLRDYGRRVRYAKRTRRLFWASLYDRFTNGR